MNTKLTIVDKGINIEDYINSSNKDAKIRDKLVVNDFVILPHMYAEKQYYYAQESVDFVKYCRNSDKGHKIDILDNGDIEIRSLHSFDIWLPVIWVANSVLLPFIINLVTNYVYDKMKGRENEEPEIDVTFEVKDGEKSKLLHYKGDLKGYKESFEKIDITKL